MLEKASEDVNEGRANLPIQDSYRERARRSNLIYHPKIELINYGFHRGVLVASSALARSHIGYQIADGVTAAMATLDITTDPGGLKEWGSELLFVS